MDNFTIRDIVVEDIPALAAYLSRKSGGSYQQADWIVILQWIWVANPNVQKSNRQIGWLIIDAQKNIAGVLGSVPVQCMVHGELKDASWATTWFVDEAVRNQSLALFMKYLAQQGLLVSNTPNAEVEKMLVKLFKYKRADTDWFRGSYLFPLKPVNGYFSEKKGQVNPIKKMKVPVLAAALKIPQAIVFLSMRTSKIFRDLSVTLLNDVSDNTDVWFTAFNKQHSCVLVRSAEMYRWFFFNPATKNLFRVFEIVYENKVQGYLVFKHRYNAGADFSYLELVDEALLELPVSVHEKIMAKAYYEVNKLAKMESLLIMRSNSKAVHTSLRKLLGVPLKKVEKTYYRAGFLQPGEIPFLTSLDGDNIFF